MKRLILIKECSAVQLGHLYEHIFCMSLTAFFKNHQLFPHKDYSLVGRTYYGGLVYIDVELYNDKAVLLAKSIPTIAISTDKGHISVAIKQMIAEKEQLFSSTGYEKIEGALKDLHMQPWQDIDEVELIDTKIIHKKRGALYIADDARRPARKLTTHIVLDAQLAHRHRELLPLFRQFAWIITASLQDTLANTYGYYSQDDEYISSRNAARMVNTFKVAYADDQNLDIHQVLKTCLEVARDIQQHQVFERYIEELGIGSYFNHSDLAPNLERTYEDTHILIGPKGWQKLANNENYRLLLKHTSIEVIFGRDKISHKLID